jgi:hypothetical protein
MVKGALALLRLERRALRFIRDANIEKTERLCRSGQTIRFVAPVASHPAMRLKLKQTC